MEKKQIEKLLKAGYTLDEVLELIPDDDATSAASGESSNAGEEEEERVTSSSPGISEKDINDISTWLADVTNKINEQIEEIKKAQQTLNGKVYDTENPLESPLTSKDVFNQVYNPPMYFDEEGETK